MSEKHNKQSYWMKRLSSQPENDPLLSAQPPSLRKSRAERLRELRALLESGVEERSVQPSETEPQPPETNPQAETMLVVIPPVEPIAEPPPPPPKPSKGKLLMK